MKLRVLFSALSFPPLFFTETLKQYHLPRRGVFRKTGTQNRSQSKRSLAHIPGTESKEKLWRSSEDC